MSPDIIIVVIRMNNVRGTRSQTNQFVVMAELRCIPCCMTPCISKLERKEILLERLAGG